jgi:hypothetical protein
MNLKITDIDGTEFEAAILADGKTVGDKITETL